MTARFSLAYGKDALRNEAIHRSLFPPTTLKSALEQLGFVQADPIRAPARAQDLILRHRVEDYRNGDLDRFYSTLDAEEDILYAYGFMPRPVWRLLHPRNLGVVTKFEQKVLEIVRANGPMHPRDLEAHLGRKRVINAWGGYSKATTQALDDLLYRGMLRVARRENGIRIFEVVSETIAPLERAERLRKLMLVAVNVLAPIPEKTLRAIVVRLRLRGSARDVRLVLDGLVDNGVLERQTVDEVSYIRPRDNLAIEPAPERVRFLAPFDPVVWDRSRFEHLWGWQYRFEAYTPVAKRVRGYYAMPIIWRDGIIGWANVRNADGRLDVDTGFVSKRPAERAFRLELDREIANFETFMSEPRSYRAAASCLL
jgi:uncharacterized protein YcaQ